MLDAPVNLSTDLDDTHTHTHTQEESNITDWSAPFFGFEPYIHIRVRWTESSSSLLKLNTDWQLCADL
jgi:hypothetical protein